MTLRLVALVTLTSLVFCGVLAAAVPIKLLAVDGAPNDRFGVSVALDDDYAIVGAQAHTDANGQSVGAAYLYQASTGQLLREFHPSPPGSLDLFGDSVAIDGDLILAGAPGDTAANYGAVYVFRASTGQQLQKFISPDLQSDSLNNDLLGYSVALHGTQALAGAPSLNVPARGAAYMFNPLTGQQQAKLSPTDGASMDLFGSAVAITDKYAVIGAPGANTRGTSSGGAYVFDAITRQQLRKLVPSDNVGGDQFGYSVAVAGNIAIIGDFNQSTANRGAAYVFDLTTGNQLMKLSPGVTPGLESGAYDFGISVAMNGNLAMIGASGDENGGLNSGAAYLFNVSNGQLIDKISPADGETNQFFGGSLAFNDSHALIGAAYDSDLGSQSGSAYLYQNVPEPTAVVMLLVGTVLVAHFRQRAILS